MHDISVLDYVCLAFLFAILRQLVLVSWVFYESVRVDYFCTDESFGEIGVDLPTSLQCSFSFSYCPRSHFVSAYCIKVGNFQLIVACSHDSINL